MIARLHTILRVLEPAALAALGYLVGERLWA
jgi:hypothetical protein